MVLSPDELRRISRDLGGHGEHPPYCGDDIIRAVRRGTLTLPVGTVIEGGMGTLTVGGDFIPSRTSPPRPHHRPVVAQEDVELRIAVCRRCEYYRVESDRCGLCGCSDTMARRVASPVGTCPAGRWQNRESTAADNTQH